MGTSTFTGPIKAGDVLDTTGTTPGTIKNVGSVVLVQTAGITQAGWAAALPVGTRHLMKGRAVREIPVRRGLSWVQFVRRAKAPELPVVLLEDVGALIGLVLALAGVGVTAITGDVVWDGLGTVAIGTLLSGEAALNTSGPAMSAISLSRPVRRLLTYGASCF